MTEAALTPTFRLDGQVAVVTGAGRGIGRAAALALAQAGADVVLMSRTRADLDEVAGLVAAEGRRADVRPLDVTDADQVADAFAPLDRVDVLVNNAGTNLPQPFLEVTSEALDRMLTLNVRAAFLVAQAAARRMAAGGRGGSVVNLSSQLGHVGFFRDRSVYAATKHALEGLTRAMALELAPLGVRVNAVAPTFIDTPMTAGGLADPAFRRQVLDRIPLGRIGRVEDVMGPVVFLASPAAALVTGHSLLVDGGWTAQ